ncbi:hypothetical protein H311_01724 [Anncaliia algerae PRA109]|nr:hypothetical protein H311_01724 [Anncaliia algerae PRA109]
MCIKCNTAQMIIQKYEQALNSLCYKCKNKNCQSRRSISAGFALGNFKFKYCIILRAIFCFIMNFNNYQSINLLKMDEKTFIKIKKQLILRLKYILKIM